MKKAKDAVASLIGGLIGIALVCFLFFTKIGAFIIVIGLGAFITWFLFTMLKFEIDKRNKLNTPGQKVCRQISGEASKYANGSYYIGHIPSRGHLQWIGIVTFDSWTGLPSCQALETPINEYGSPKNANPDVPFIMLTFYSDFPFSVR